MGGLEVLTPGWLWAAPGLLGALVLLYFLKLKRREVAVSSALLWRQALDDLRVNSPLQRLRMNLLLLLQALALLLLLLALARPVADLGGLHGTDSLLLVDVSASMQATDGAGGAPGGETRFARAVAEARRVVDDLGRGDRAIVVAFDDQARVVTPLTDSKPALRAALDALAPTDRPTRLAPALDRVQVLLQDAARDPAVYVFTDGRVGPLDRVGLDPRVPLHYVRVGALDARNVGITGLDVRASSGLGDGGRVLVTLHDASPPGPARTLGLDLRLEGELAGSRSVTVTPGQATTTVFEVDPTREGRVEVRLDLGAERATDALPADDVAWGLLRPDEPVRVLLVTPGNLFLDSALREDPLVWKDARGELPVRAPEGFVADDPALLDYDLIVLDRTSPAALPPGSFLFFAGAPPFPGLEDLGNKRDWRVLDWDEAHEATRFVNFSTLNLPVGQRFALRDGDQALVRANHGPLVFTCADGDRRALVCAFDLMSLPVEGAWTFDPSYPIFLANAVRWLGGASRDRKGLLVRTAGTAELRLPPGARRAELTPPGGGPTRPLAIAPTDDALRVTDLDRAGLYEVAYFAAPEPGGEPTRRVRFAANLLDPDEAAVAAAGSLVVADRAPLQGVPRAAEQNRDLWRWAAALALAVLLLEWWVYNRRVFV